jgi:hypothetical protein
MAVLGLLLVPGDQDAFLQGCDELHGRNASARGEPGSLLGRLAGDTCHLQHAGQGIIAPEHGIVLVEVPAPAQQHLGAAVDDLAVRKIGAFLAFQQRLAFVAVQGQGQPGFE